MNTKKTGASIHCVVSGPSHFDSKPLTGAVWGLSSTLIFYFLFFLSFFNQSSYFKQRSGVFVSNMATLESHQLPVSSLSAVGKQFW